jgi:hypothetical protein
VKSPCFLAGLIALWVAIALSTAASGQVNNEGAAPYASELLGCIDPESGAVVRVPMGEKAAAVCQVFDSVWASAALDALGLHDEAERALAVHVATVRDESGTDTPAGSLPREIRPDGRAASFRGNADPESAAWLLAACWRHGASLSASERIAYLGPIWPRLSLAADYLAREPTVGGALSGALPASAAPLDLLRTHYLGLESSRLAAEALGREEPGLWSDRRGEIYARIRFRTLNQTGDDATMKPWVNWWVALMPGAQADEGWDVLKTAEAPVLTDAAITEWVAKEGALRRAALRCLFEG